MPNRLSNEQSPYLKQHEDNPVDWYPWSDEAIERAKREDKPILLSVGYSACHWCHVMAHESFENPEIARLMNEHFINIKVDREEHPDVDQIYQQVTQLMTRSGGWPLTVFLTPDLKPFFGGTYYPPEDRYGRPGFSRLLEALSRAYREQRGDIEENAHKLLSAMRDDQPQKGTRVPREFLFRDLRTSAETLLRSVDWEHGGFGGAPKFPNVMALTFLLRSGKAFDLKPARQAAILALVRMAEGGIYDQLCGGFHRYSVDDRWAVPHFEKMLYDNALLLRLYSEVLLGSSGELAPDIRELFVNIVAETVEYVLREMTHSMGGFYSAQDADSEGEEGKFFVWTLQELNEILSPKEAQVFALRHGVSDSGNFEHGTNVFYLSKSLSAISEQTGLSLNDVRENLAFACAKLRERRSARVAPGLDDKILVSWNGLMVSGLAWASKALDQAGRFKLAHRASIAAHRGWDWISEHSATAESGGFYAVLGGDGSSRIRGRIDDSAFMIRAGLDLLRFLPEEALGTRYSVIKSRLILWAEWAWKSFADRESCGFFLTEEGRKDLIQRPVSLHDQVIPSGAAVLMDSYLELEALAINGSWSSDLEARLLALRESVMRNPFAFSETASALLRFALGTVVLKGAGSQKFQGHFSVTQDVGFGDLMLCHQQTCENTEPAGVLSRLQALLVPSLQSSSG